MRGKNINRLPRIANPPRLHDINEPPGQGTGRRLRRTVPEPNQGTDTEVPSQTHRMRHNSHPVLRGGRPEAAQGRSGEDTGCSGPGDEVLQLERVLQEIPGGEKRPVVHHGQRDQGGAENPEDMSREDDQDERGDKDRNFQLVRGGEAADRGRQLLQLRHLRCHVGNSKLRRALRGHRPVLQVT